MMRHARLLAAALALAALAGCSSLNIDKSAAALTNGINSVTSALTSPQANQAVANLEAGSTAIICNIQAGATEALTVEAAFASGSAAAIDPKSTLGKIYETTSTVVAVSAAVCTGLRGTVGGKAYVSAISNGVATAAPLGPTQ
jgi:hypothetical protein